MVEIDNNHIILSVKPVFAHKIMSGEKRVELRKRFPSTSYTRTWIYSTFPEQAIIGRISVNFTFNSFLSDIWEEYAKHYSCVSKEYFDKYFKNPKHGMGAALILQGPILIGKPVPLAELRERFGFTPPQSYMYAKEDLRDYLQSFLSFGKRKDNTHD